MGPSPAAAVQDYRPQLLERRARLVAAAVSDDYLSSLLAEVDAALHKLDCCTFGYCETCHDPIEPERLECDPLVRFCLDHLSPAELQAHQRDLDLAVVIQEKLLPPHEIVVPAWDIDYRYQPAGAVGGDYCEMIPLANGGLFFAVGDVTGKGVAASLLMTHLNAIFRSLLSLGLPLAEVLTRANHMFCESTPAAHYATLVCGLACAESIELSNAGRCVPLVAGCHGIRRLESSGLPLGLFSNAPFPADRLHLEIGESLILYTDGITEALDPASGEFGEDRLCAAALTHLGGCAAEMASGILRELAAFRKDRGLTDDVTLLIMRKNS